MAALLVLVGLVLTVPRSWRLKPAKPAAAGSGVSGPPSATAAPVTTGAYVSAPAVTSYPQPDGHSLTLVRFMKLEGPWNAQPSKFDLWFDGDVEQEFESRGFESPVSFDVQLPEPRHFSITVGSPPVDAARYVVFTFKSAKPVALVRSDVAPKRAEDAGRQ